MANKKFKRIVGLDFETYYDQEYTLRKMSNTSYVRDERFKVQCVSIQTDRQKRPKNYHGKGIAKALNAIDWKTTALMCHHTQFDGFILSQHYDIIPAYYMCTLSMARPIHGGQIRNSLNELAKFYGLQNKLTDVLEQTKGVRDLPPELRRSLGAYCDVDVEIMWGIFHKMLVKYPDDELDLIHRTISAFCDPILIIDKEICQNEHKRERRKRQRIVRETGLTLTQLRSRKTFPEVLIEAGGEPPQIPDPKHKGQTKTTFNKNNLDFQALFHHPNKRVRQLVRARQIASSSIDATRALRILEHGNPTLPIYLNYGKAHTLRWCMPPNAEVLTPKGWVHMFKYDNQPIMQWEENGTLSWCNNASMNRFLFDGELHVIDSQYVKGAFTPEHKMPLFNSKKRFVVHTAKTAHGRHLTIPNTGVLHGKNIAVDENILRLQIAFQADGSFHGNRVRFKFRKHRKIERLKQILNDAGILFRITKYKIPQKILSTYKKIIATHETEVSFQYDRILGLDKNFSYNLMNLNLRCRNIILSEIKYWDGCDKGKGFVQYSTTNKNNAEIIQTLANITGKKAHICIEEKENPKWATKYTVGYGSRLTSRTNADQWHMREYSGAVYCPTVDTGFFIVRYRGAIHITGNSGGDKMNAQNLPRASKLRNAIKAPPGYKLVIVDSTSIELHVAATVAGEEQLIEACRDPARDPYCEFASESIYHKPINKADHWKERFVGKVGLLSLQYQTGHKKLQHTLESGAMGVAVSFKDKTMYKKIVTGYRQRYQAINQAWTDMDLIINEMRCGRSGDYGPISYDGQYIHLPNGLYLMYPNLRTRVDEDSGYIETVYGSGKGSKIYPGLLFNNIIQALARIVVSEQILMVEEKYKNVLLVHDELVCCVRERSANRCFKQMMNAFHTPPKWLPELPVAGEGGIVDYYQKM